MKMSKAMRKVCDGSGLILVMMLLLVLVGCGGDSTDNGSTSSDVSSAVTSGSEMSGSEASEPASSVAPADITAKIMETLTFDDEMMEIESDLIERQYGIDMDKVEAASVYVVSSGAVADEVAVFQAKSAEDVAEIETALHDRVETVMERFVDYLPDEVPKIEGAIVKTNGDYLLLVIHNDAIEAEKIFDESL